MNITRHTALYVLHVCTAMYVLPCMYTACIYYSSTVCGLYCHKSNTFCEVLDIVNRKLNVCPVHQDTWQYSYSVD